MAWTDTGLKTCILPAVLTLNPLRMENKKEVVSIQSSHFQTLGVAPPQIWDQCASCCPTRDSGYATLDEQKERRLLLIVACFQAECEQGGFQHYLTPHTHLFFFHIKIN